MTAPSEQRPRAAASGRRGVTLFFAVFAAAGLVFAVGNGWLAPFDAVLAVALALGSAATLALVAGRGSVPRETSLLEWLGLLALTPGSMVLIGPDASLVVMPAYLAMMGFLRLGRWS